MCEIDRISSISVEDFYKRYLLPNKPCIFTAEFTKDWPCRSDWTESGSGDIAIETLLAYKKPGDNVTVADCDQLYFDSHRKEQMPVEEFVRYWRQRKQKGVLSADLCHGVEDSSQLSTNSTSNRLLYLKDWHFFLDLTQEKESSVFCILPHFASDWLNEFWAARADLHDDYKFVYIGVAGTWTGFHADVMRSYSWSTNVAGRKRWLLLAPGQEKHIPAGTTDLRCVEGVSSLQLDQGPGETVFVPSGWWHQVHNETDCVSINHNWLNGASALCAWAHLCDQLNEVEAATSDVVATPGYVEQCQVCLRAYSGMNLQEWGCMLLLVIWTRACTALICSEEPLKPSIDTTHMQSQIQQRLVAMEPDILRMIRVGNRPPLFLWVDLEAAIRCLRLLQLHPHSHVLHLFPSHIELLIARLHSALSHPISTDISDPSRLKL